MNLSPLLLPLGPVLLGDRRLAVLAQASDLYPQDQLSSLCWELRNLGAAGFAGLPHISAPSGLPSLMRYPAPVPSDDLKGVSALLMPFEKWGKETPALPLVILVKNTEELTQLLENHEKPCHGVALSLSDPSRFSAQALLGWHQRSSLPLIADLSESSLSSDLLTSQVLSLFSMGVDAVLVRIDPSQDPVQGPETLNLEGFGELMVDVKNLSTVLGKELLRIPQSPPVFGASDTGPGSSGRVLSPVSFQGEHGAYSEMAVYAVFPKDQHKALPKKNFRDVFESVLVGECTYGVVPVENALAGSVYDNYDLLLEYADLHIVSEVKIRIEHNLIGCPGTNLDQIRRVFSHPQGLAQSAAFLDRFPHWERVPFYDTAGSVAHVAQAGQPELAAIASSEAARVYGMEILKAGIETNPKNFTRFFVLSRTDVKPLGTPNKASLVFSTAHSPGALSQCLAILAGQKLNMKRLESRPIHGKPWEYMFYVDVEVPAEESLLAIAIERLKQVSEDFRVLGVYHSKNP